MAVRSRNRLVARLLPQLHPNIGNAAPLTRDVGSPVYILWACRAQIVNRKIDRFWKSLEFGRSKQLHNGSEFQH